MKKRLIDAEHLKKTIVQKWEDDLGLVDFFEIIDAEHEVDAIPVEYIHSVIGVYEQKIKDIEKKNSFVSYMIENVGMGALKTLLDAWEAFCNSHFTGGFDNDK